LPNTYSPREDAIKGLVFSIPILVLLGKEPVSSSIAGVSWQRRAGIGVLLLVAGISIGLFSLEAYRDLLWQVHRDR
jgi:hypothetical protein